MKFLIASDIHGSAFWCGKLMEIVRNEQPDKLLLLGDILYHGPRNDLPREYAPKQVIAMLTEVKEKILCVRGNCEAEVDQMVLPFPCMADYALVEADGLTLYLTHGHHADPNALPPLPKGTARSRPPPGSRCPARRSPGRLPHARACPARPPGSASPADSSR